MNEEQMESAATPAASTTCRKCGKGWMIAAILLLITSIALGAMVFMEMSDSSDSMVMDDESSEEMEDGEMMENDEVEEVAKKDSEVCLANYEATNVVENEHHDVTFDYPCEWTLRDPGVGVTVTSPNKTASFTWASADFGLHDFELTKEDQVSVNGVQEPRKTYEFNDKKIVIIDAEIPSASGASYIVLSYSGEEGLDELNALVSSFSY